MEDVKDLLSISEKAKLFEEVLRMIREKKDAFNYASDVFTTILRERIDFIDELYETREETREINGIRGLIREQKRNLNYVLNLFENEDLKSNLETPQVNDVRNKLIEAYEYCLEKGFLEHAQNYLKFLSKNDLVDDDFIQKGLFDIVSRYAKLSVLTDTDQTQHVINLDNDIRNGVYKDAGKEIRQDALVATFNEEGVDIYWDGMILI